MNKAKAIFLDKDGTLVRDVPYNVSPEKIVLSREMIEGLKLFRENDFLLIVVSNQSGIARGYFSEQELYLAIRHTQYLLENEGVDLGGFYYCPHHPDGKVSKYSMDCDCRKPTPGMLLEAAKDHNIDLSQSWMIGDILNDVEAGKLAGCRTVLINNGNETEWIMNPQRCSDLISGSINEAAKSILQTQKATSVKVLTP